jgi:hypothetical protein
LYLQTEHHLLMKQDAEGAAKTSKMTNRISQASALVSLV